MFFLSTTFSALFLLFFLLLSDYTNSPHIHFPLHITSFSQISPSFLLFRFLPTPDHSVSSTTLSSCTLSYISSPRILFLLPSTSLVHLFSTHSVLLISILSTLFLLSFLQLSHSTNSPHIYTFPFPQHNMLPGLSIFAVAHLHASLSSAHSPTDTTLSSA
jgi:hypothetical protein